MPLSAGNVPVTIPKYFFMTSCWESRNWIRGSFAKMTRPEVLRSKRETGWILCNSNVQHSYTEYCHLPLLSDGPAFRLVY